MAISNELLSSTLYSILDEERDALYQGTPFMDWASKLGGIHSESGGTKIVVPVGLEEHSTLTPHVTGYEPMTMAFNDVMQPAEYEWADFSAPIGISKKEESENAGEAAQVKIIEVRLRNVMSMAKRNINAQILAGAGLGTLGTLNGHTLTTGFIENGAPAAATQTNTVGGIKKDTVDAVGWYNQYQTAAAAFGTDGIRLMQQLLNTCNARAQKGQIKLTIMSEAGYANYRRALFTNERYIDEKTLDGGRLGIAFGGGIVEQDLAMPINGGVGVDEYTAYLLNFDSIKLAVHKDCDFSVTPFMDVAGTTVRSATLYWKGQLMAEHLGSVGVLVDGDTW